MDQPTGGTAHAYEETVVVELTGENDAGEPTVVSYEFDVDGGTASPRQPVADAHEGAVRDLLDEQGYALAEG